MSRECLRVLDHLPPGSHIHSSHTPYYIYTRVHDLDTLHGGSTHFGLNFRVTNQQTAYTISTAKFVSCGINVRI